MARIVMVQLLVDADSEAAIADGLNDALRQIVHPMGTGTAENSFILDYRLAGEGSDGDLYVAAISSVIEDSVVNETYAEGDAFKTSGMLLPVDKDYDWPIDGSHDAQCNCADSIWITVPPPEPNPDYPAGVTGNLSVYIKRTHEGVIVDVFAGECEDQDSIAGTCAEFNDAAGLQSDVPVAA